MLDRRKTFGGPHQLYLFFHEIYMVARSYQALAAEIKSLLIESLVTLGTRLKVPILAIF